jgi:hypothetical protein
MADCNHRWRKVLEQCHVGPAYTTGWECVDCEKSVNNCDVTPEGLGGSVLKKAYRVTLRHSTKEKIVDENGVIVQKE